MFKSLKDCLKYAVSTSKEIIDSSPTIDNKILNYYAIAEREINNSDIDNGLWSYALVRSKGNEELRKSEYIKLRVEQLKNDNEKVEKNQMSNHHKTKKYIYGSGTNDEVKICPNCGFDYSGTPYADTCYRCHLPFDTSQIDDHDRLKVCPHCGFNYSGFPYATICFKCHKNLQ